MLQACRFVSIVSFLDRVQQKRQHRVRNFNHADKNRNRNVRDVEAPKAHHVPRAYLDYHQRGAHLEVVLAMLTGSVWQLGAQTERMAGGGCKLEMLKRNFC